MNKIIPIDSNKPGKIAEIVNKHYDEQVLIWTQFDEEGEILHKLIPDSNIISGKTKQEIRLQYLEDFRKGDIRVMISKPKLMGTGLNLQYCHVCIFSWSKDSFEEFYQAVGRLQRYGQKNKVTIYIPYTEVEFPMLKNVMRKQKTYLEDSSFQEDLYKNSLLDELKEYSNRDIAVDETKENLLPPVEEERYSVINGDCIQEMAKMEENQFDLAVFSPPFADLFSYTDQKEDMGNCNGSDDEFELHFSFFVHQLFRVMNPGCAVGMHIAPLAILQSVAGYSGIRDFPGECINIFTSNGFIYEGRATIGKNPQAQAIRTHSHRLLFKTLKNDSRKVSFAIPDYLLKFRMPGESKPIPNGNLTNDDWVKLAHPIWDWVRETHTLNKGTKSNGDTKHICPLQLDVIDACIKLWSAPGERVFSPFMGIGSEGVMAMRLDRKFTGIELKREYFLKSIKNLEEELQKQNSGTVGMFA